MAGQHFKTVKLSTILVATAPCEHLTISSLGKLAFLVACGFFIIIQQELCQTSAQILPESRRTICLALPRENVVVFVGFYEMVQ